MSGFDVDDTPFPFSELFSVIWYVLECDAKVIVFRSKSKFLEVEDAFKIEVQQIIHFS